MLNLGLKPFQTISNEFGSPTCKYLVVTNWIPGGFGQDSCGTHRYDYEASWWIYLVALAVTEASLRLWQIKRPDLSKRQVAVRLGIRLLVASIAFGVGYFARADIHEPPEGGP